VCGSVHARLCGGGGGRALKAWSLGRWRVMREQINAFVRLANAKMPADLAPLSEVGE
jgi:hypothetical protein